MPKRTDRSSGPRNGTVLLVAIVAALGVGAMATYMSRTPAAMKVPPELRREEHVKSITAQKPVATEPVVQAGGMDVRLPVLKGETVELADEATKTETPVKAVAEAAIAVAHLDGVKLMGATFKEGTVTLDFNATLGEGVGSMQEGRFIDAITQGMRQIKGADRVRIFSEGRPLETLGHFQWGEAISLKEGEEPQP